MNTHIITLTRDEYCGSTYAACTCILDKDHQDPLHKCYCRGTWLDENHPVTLPNGVPWSARGLPDPPWAIEYFEKKRAIETTVKEEE